MVRSGGGGFTFVISSTSQLMTNEPTSFQLSKREGKTSYENIYMYIQGTCVMRDYGVKINLSQRRIRKRPCIKLLK